MRGRHQLALQVEGDQTTNGASGADQCNATLGQGERPLGKVQQTDLPWQTCGSLPELLDGLGKQIQPNAKLDQQHEKAGSSSDGAQDEGTLSRGRVDEDAEVDQDPDGTDCQPA